MKKYRIRTKEIKEKVKHVKELLKRDLTADEKEKVEITLFTYLTVLNTVSNTTLLNFFDQMTNGRLSQNKWKQAEDVAESLHNNYIDGKDYIDSEYLQFLLEIINNVAVPGTKEPEFMPISISDEQLIQTAQLFYKQLGDEKISECSSKIITQPNSVTITQNSNEVDTRLFGIAVYDHIYYQPYITVYKQNNIKDVRTVVHEIMHGIDFLILPKLYSKTYYGFPEVPTYTIDYLTADFLEQMGIDSNEVNKLRAERDAYLCNKAFQVQFQINRKLRKKGIDVDKSYTIEDVKSIMDFDMLKSILEVVSGVMAYGFYQQIKIDKQQGLANLKKFMSSNISKDKAPDFTTYGLSNEVLIKLSYQIALDQKRKKQLDNQEELEQPNSLQQSQAKVRRLVKPSMNDHAFINSSFLVIVISSISVVLAILWYINLYR